MEDFKIRVTTEQESKEAQELFFELGYSWPGCEKYYNRIGNYTFITAYPDEMLLRMAWGGDTDKEITIPQLKDMVVLKRNCVNDKNVEDGTLHDLYQDSDGVVYFYNHNKNQWKRSHINNSDHYLALVKPIKKEVAMKEYIAKVDGEWRLVEDSEVVSGRVEVPEGAESFNYHDDISNTFFLKSYCDETLYSNSRSGWKWSDWGDIDFDDVVCLWSREKVEVESEKLDTDAMLSDIDVQIATYSQHGHYFKDVRDLSVIDVYQVLRLFNVTDPCLQHIVKKALVAGGRGHKNFERDLRDIHDTSKRALEINNILH